MRNKKDKKDNSRSSSGLIDPASLKNALDARYRNSKTILGMGSPIFKRSHPMQSLMESLDVSTTPSMTRTIGRKSQVARSVQFNVMAKSTFQSPSQLKKTKGFIDFDLQIKRPDITKNQVNAHERRFDAFQFPKVSTDYKTISSIDFNKMRMRDNLLQKNTKCSDSLFDHK